MAYPKGSVSELTSSSESAAPPRDFHVSPSSSQGQLTPPVHQVCQMCRRSRKDFTCVQCIQRHDFKHSERMTVTMCEKKLEFNQLKAETRKTIKLVEERSARILVENKLREEIELTRQMIAVKGILYEQSQKQLKRLREDVKLIENENKKLKEKRVSQAMERLREKMNKSKNVSEGRRTETIARRKKEHRIVQSLISQLRQFIFPIREIRSLGTPTKEGQDETLEDLLREASREQSISRSHNSEPSFSIAGPCLPANGDYGVLLRWVGRTQDEKEAEVARNEAHEISAGLMHLAQLVQSVAIFLDLPLPYPMYFSEFSADILAVKEVENKIARLNANVVYLCISQQVTIDDSSLQRTVMMVVDLLEKILSGKTVIRECFEMTPMLTFAFNRDLIEQLRPFDTEAEMKLVRTGQNVPEPTDENDDFEDVQKSPMDDSLSMFPVIQQASAVSMYEQSRTRSSSISSLNFESLRNNLLPFTSMFTSSQKQ